MLQSRIVAVIPARMASSRLPGKPLLPFYGLPMVEHVRRRAVLSGAFAEVVVATCDNEIAAAIEQFGGKVVMTASTHETATDRVAEAFNQIEGTHVVNVQGDEILVLPEDLARMVAAISDSPETPAWNALAGIEDRGELSDRSIVKCVISRSNRVLFCTRNFSFLSFSNNDFDPVRKILGILAFERTFLGRIMRAGRTPLEVLESIDQSRIVETDEVLHGVDFVKGYPGINLPHEVETVKHYLEHDSRQRSVLQTILSHEKIER
jgi:3-deoxy-manno-octulosonate cytidylyltransferase (CMP-KDO synthetase)